MTDILKTKLFPEVNFFLFNKCMFSMFVILIRMSRCREQCNFCWKCAYKEVFYMMCLFIEGVTMEGDDCI